MRSPYVVRGGQAFSSGGRSRTLSSLDLELTEDCGFDCIHCAVRRDSLAPHRETEAMSESLVARILGEAAALGCETVRFTGGEPLLREDFPEIYLAARRLGLRVLLFTNAAAVTPGLADLLARVPPLAPVEISLYGFTEASFGAVTRRPASFAGVKRGIALLAERGVRMALKGVLFPFNAAEQEALEGWARDLLGPAAGVSWISTLELRHRRDSERRNEAIRRLRLPPEEIPGFMARGRRAYRRETKEFLLRFAGPKGVKLFTCGAGRELGCVDAKGRLHACLSLRDPSLAGDLRQEPLAAAAAGVRARIERQRAADPEYLRRCARCPLHGLCEQCPAKSWMETGRLDVPIDYFCRVTHAQVRQLGLLGEREAAWEVTDWKARVEAMTVEEEA